MYIYIYIYLYTYKRIYTYTCIFYIYICIYFSLLPGPETQDRLPKMHLGKELPMSYEKMHIKIQKGLLPTFVPWFNKCFAVHCRVMQDAAVFSGVFSVLQSAAACSYKKLHIKVPKWLLSTFSQRFDCALQCIAVFGSVFQCGVFWCDAVCCSVATNFEGTHIKVRLGLLPTFVVWYNCALCIVL